MTQLAAIERRTGRRFGPPTAPERFGHLITALRERTGQRVAVLVDEYDKPILDALEKPEVARANRDYLRGLYSTIKFADADVKFTLLTGVSKFSRVSLFSGLNNLVDITLEPEYSTICGYTDADLDTVFAPELPGLDRDRIREWYNGYSWLGEQKVYNPFDVLLLFRPASLRGVVVRDRHPDVPRGHRCSRAASARWSSTACEPATICWPPSTWTTSPPRRCSSRPAT